ncbi:hypothetical protein GGR75_003727 [Xanthomonas campestris]|nr:hypothetical protein [Xanthomonas campestris]MEC5197169.1 hypothetical protein [Xanthomonas campestris]
MIFAIAYSAQQSKLLSKAVLSAGQYYFSSSG